MEGKKERKKERKIKVENIPSSTGNAFLLPVSLDLDVTLDQPTVYYSPPTPQYQ
jgi:hypothetical protein